MEASPVWSKNSLSLAASNKLTLFNGDEFIEGTGFHCSYSFRFRRSSSPKYLLLIFSSISVISERGTDRGITSKTIANTNTPSCSFSRCSFNLNPAVTDCVEPCQKNIGGRCPPYQGSSLCRVRIAHRIVVWQLKSLT